MESAVLEGTVEACVDCEVAAVDSCVADDLLPRNDVEVFEAVGVMGDEVSLTGEVGESRSRDPVESFVRFFFRNPRVGIDAAVEECCWPALARPACPGTAVGALHRGCERDARETMAVLRDAS
jgi:hypothetical protein